jgi:hypothetical protein
MEENKAEYGCILQIFTEDEHPEIITKMTGVEASYIHIKSMPKVNRETGNTIGNLTYKENVWFWKSFYEGNTWDFAVGLDTALNNILQIIISNVEQFRIIFNKYQYYRIMCYGYIYDYHIAFKLQSETIKKIDKLGIPIEFDFYSFSDE